MTEFLTLLIGFGCGCGATLGAKLIRKQIEIERLKIAALGLTGILSRVNRFLAENKESLNQDRLEQIQLGTLEALDRLNEVMETPMGWKRFPPKQGE